MFGVLGLGLKALPNLGVPFKGIPRVKILDDDGL